MANDRRIETTIIEIIPKKKRKLRNGGIIKQDGYIYIRLEEDDPFHPMADCWDDYVAEHRLVVAKSLGRLLTKDEVVHHLNEIRNDNRIENLLLTTKAGHDHEHWLMGTYSDRVIAGIKISKALKGRRPKNLDKLMSHRGPDGKYLRWETPMGKIL